MANNDREGTSLARLAKLYSADGRMDAAAKCYETMLASSCTKRDVRMNCCKYHFYVLRANFFIYLAAMTLVYFFVLESCGVC